MKPEVLGKLLAVAMWADDKVAPEEWGAALDFAANLGCSREEVKQSIIGELEILHEDCGEDDGVELDITPVDVAALEGVDLLDLLSGIFQVFVADKVVDVAEVAVAHLIGKALGAYPEDVSIALLDVVAKGANEVRVSRSTEEEEDV